MKIYSTEIETPLGQIIVFANMKGVCLLEFIDQKNINKQIDKIVKIYGGIEKGTNPHLELLKKELDEYFSGTRYQFTVPLDVIGTDFQKEVWEELLNIPFGKTISYLEQAKKMGKPKSVRAVANANGANKISIIIPCHRVVGNNGTLTGYAGGLDRKRWLLDLESNEKTLFV